MVKREREQVGHALKTTKTVFEETVDEHEKGITRSRLNNCMYIQIVLNKQ